MSAVFTSFVYAEHEGHLCIHFIDVEQGDAILISSPEGFYGLIDGGDRSARIRDILLGYLIEHNVTALEFIVSTHPHADHIGGLIPVLENTTVSRVYDSGRVHTTLLYEEYLTLIDRLNIPFYTPRRGDSIELGSVSLDVLHPTEPVGNYSLNDASIVLRLSYGDISFMFTGDSESRGELEIVSMGLEISSAVLKVAHHGSKTSTTVPFLNAVDPSFAVILVGEDNRYGLPSQEVLDRLNSRNILILRTDHHGHIRICSDGNGLWVFTEKNVEEPDDDEPEPETDCQPGQININTASITRLQDLTGIGPTLAARIIEYRETYGHFRQNEDIMNVPGIAEGRFNQIKDAICIR